MKALTAFETALEDVRVNLDPDDEEPLQLIIANIKKALTQIAHLVFPHRSLLETQHLWMNRGMRKPAAAAIS